VILTISMIILFGFATVQTVLYFLNLSSYQQLSFLIILILS
jgi:hypothetical protein